MEDLFGYSLIFYALSVGAFRTDMRAALDTYCPLFMRARSSGSTREPGPACGAAHDRDSRASAMASFKDDPDYLGPISATPQKMVEEMLAVAGVTAADVVYDLGCNDGRVLVTAAANAGARGVGVEIDEGAVKKARTKVRVSSSSPASSVPRSSYPPRLVFPSQKPNQWASPDA